MATTPGASDDAAAASPYTPLLVAHELRRQMSMPAALAATFAACGSSRSIHGWPRNLGDDDDDGDGDNELRGGHAPRPATAAGGVGAVVRALWAWVSRGSNSRRRKAVMIMSRSGSSVKREQQRQYGQEEYAQNFDEGGAAAEPENLPRSFSARWARRRG